MPRPTPSQYGHGFRSAWTSVPVCAEHLRWRRNWYKRPSGYRPHIASWPPPQECNRQPILRVATGAFNLKNGETIIEPSESGTQSNPRTSPRPTNLPAPSRIWRNTAARSDCRSASACKVPRQSAF